MEQYWNSAAWIDEYLQWAVPKDNSRSDTALRGILTMPDEADTRFATAYLDWMDARHAAAPRREPNSVEPRPVELLRDAILIAALSALQETRRSAPDTAQRTDREIDLPHTLESVAALLRTRYGAAGTERARV